MINIAPLRTWLLAAVRACLLLSIMRLMNNTLSSQRFLHASPSGTSVIQSRHSPLPHDLQMPSAGSSGWLKQFMIYSFYFQRHGSGDPTLCGGYPGTDCSTRFVSVFSTISSVITPCLKRCDRSSSSRPLRIKYSCLR